MTPRPAPRVAVLMGGPSEEHGISLKSGHGVTDALLRRGFPAVAVMIPKAGTAQEACASVKEALQREAAEVAFIALHGAFGEDGTVQALCEELGIAYTGSDAAASRLGMDKVASRQRFEQAGLAVPRWTLLTVSSTPSPRPPARFSFPLVVKPVNQGSSLGVSIVPGPEQFAEAAVLAGRFGPQVLIEEFVQGRELTIGVLGEEPLPIVEIRPKDAFFDYTAKYTAGLTEYLVPAPLEPSLAKTIQAAGLAAHQALGCRHLSRTDVILNQSQVPVVLEVNTIPGFTPTSLLPKAAACLQLSYEQVCEELVMMAWQGTRHLAHSVGAGAR